MHYKDSQNNLHYLDSAQYEHLLPAGCVPITDDEAQDLRPKPDPKAQRKQAILSELAKLDTEGLRQVRAVVIEQANGRKAPAFDMTKLQKLDAIAQALRAELGGL